MYGCSDFLALVCGLDINLCKLRQGYQDAPCTLEDFSADDSPNRYFCTDGNTSINIIQQSDDSIIPDVITTEETRLLLCMQEVNRWQRLYSYKNNMLYDCSYCCYKLGWSRFYCFTSAILFLKIVPHSFGLIYICCLCCWLCLTHLYCRFEFDNLLYLFFHFRLKVGHNLAF